MPPNQWQPQQSAQLQQFHQSLMKNMPFKRVYYKTLQAGSLAHAQYLYWKHDPSPLILVTDVFPDRIRGINLHYLTFKFVKDLLMRYCGNRGFKYNFIKNDFYIVNAFRTYKKAGLRNLQLLDCEMIKMQLQEQTRPYRMSPHEKKAIQTNLRNQLRSVTNPNASDLVKTNTQPQTTINNQQPPMGMTAPRPATIPTQSATISGQ